MSVNIPIDEDLLKKAIDLSPIKDPAVMIRQIVEKYVHRREMGNLAIALGGTMPDLEVEPRRPSGEGD